ncbi:MAG: GTPase domain-containing protein [Roseomonas sp.]|nr:GTPase domain-containing protein [Roseomonas sp.]
MVGAEPEGLTQRLGRFLRAWWRFILRGALITLPTLALLPLGVLWLLESGVALEWFIGWGVAAFLGLAAGSLWRPVLPPIQLKQALAGAPPAERDARARIKKIIEEATAQDIQDADALRALLLRVFSDVAAAYHPARDMPILEVTLPEMLRAVELTSRGLRSDLLRVFPSARDITFRAVDTAAEMKAWFDVGMPLFRTGRFIGRIVANPVNALVGELASVATGLSQRGLTPMMKRRAAEIIVRQAGETAILLYSGQCRLEHDVPPAGLPRARAPVEVRQPTRVRMRVGVVGQVNAGKSSLVNALVERSVNLSGLSIHTAGEHDFAVDLPGLGPVELVDTPGLRHGEAPPLDRIVGADMVLWAVALHRADRAPDADLAHALRQWSAKHAGRRVPPVIVVPTHMDRLDPPGEWEPPYDWKQGSRLKEQSTRAALQAVQDALAWPEARWVPAVLRDGRPFWNLDAVRKEMVLAKADAELTQNSRRAAGRTWWDSTVDAVHSAGGGVSVAMREVRRLFGVRRG